MFLVVLRTRLPSLGLFVYLEIIYWKMTSACASVFFDLKTHFKMLHFQNFRDEIKFKI